MRSHTTLLSSKCSSFTGSFFMIVSGALLLAISAKIQVPLMVIKASLQPAAVLALGLLFGHRVAVFAVILYLVEGACGMPVFQGTPERGIGISYMVGPTGGYLFGFVVAAWITGKWGYHVTHYGRLLAVCSLGCVTIYLFGLVWLRAVVGNWTTAWAVGAQPLLVSSAVQVAMVATAYRLWKR